MGSFYKGKPAMTETVRPSGNSTQTTKSARIESHANYLAGVAASAASTLRRDLNRLMNASLMVWSL